MQRSLFKTVTWWGYSAKLAPLESWLRLSGVAMNGQETALANKPLFTPAILDPFSHFSAHCYTTTINRINYLQPDGLY